ncbi:MAG: polyhydroxyalkanoate synthesis regulator DNA-binding domain-containing protein [Candidatus Sulfotelmatobacter sp.]
MPPKPVIIKKYENRRLYDTTNSRYVNLDEIARMVREGRELQVLDAATGEDLTRLVLTQIIVDDAKEQDSTFPLDILRQMVVASGKATQENTLKYMKAVVDMYQNAYRAFTPVVSPFEFMRSGTPPNAPASEPPTAATGHEQELRQRVEELEAIVTRMTPKKTAARRKKRAKAARKAPRK